MHLPISHDAPDNLHHHETEGQDQGQDQLPLNLCGSHSLFSQGCPELRTVQEVNNRNGNLRCWHPFATLLARRRADTRHLHKGLHSHTPSWGGS